MNERTIRSKLALVLMSGALAAAFAAPALAADAGAGQAVFKSVCAMCHSNQAGTNKIGPTLFGLVGRKTGSVEGYTYSPANQGANLTWDEATLDKYLQAPRTLVPGTKMTYGGLKDDEKRANLIAYLATLK